jgi:hypothetical protein
MVMTKQGYASLTLILSIVAAILAFTAAAISYLRHGELKFSLIMAGLFLLAFGFGARNKINPGT